MIRDKTTKKILKQFLWPPNVKKFYAPISFLLAVIVTIADLTTWLSNALKGYVVIAYLIITIIVYIISVLVHAFQEIEALTQSKRGLINQYRNDQREIKQLKAYSNENQQTINTILILLGQIKQEIEDLKDRSNGTREK